ncbi:MAG: hypothetical protein NTV51_10260 [Verrucomicrobia bacterium]|nr:hypothetical protein [Verrucomicrobiota bacterium]
MNSTINPSTGSQIRETSNEASLQTIRTDSLTLGGVAKPEGGNLKKNPHWTGPLTVSEHIPTITRNIDCLMTKFLLLDRRVPRSVNFKNHGNGVTYVYEICIQNGNCLADLRFNEREDINVVTLRMVGRLIFQFMFEVWENSDPSDLKRLFDETVGRMELEANEVSVVQKQFHQEIDGILPKFQFKEAA